MKVASRLLGIDNPHIIAIIRIEQDLFTSIPKSSGCLSPLNDAPTCFPSFLALPASGSNYPPVIFWVHCKVKYIVLTKETVREFPGLQRVVALSMLIMTQQDTSFCRYCVLCVMRTIMSRRGRQSSMSMESATTLWRPGNSRTVSLVRTIYFTLQ
jgi:hypothetical protein